MPESFIDLPTAQHRAFETRQEHALIYETALAMMREGLPVFPVYPGNKRPFVPYVKGFLALGKMPGPWELGEWGMIASPSNLRPRFYTLSLVTGKDSGLVVVDCDDLDATVDVLRRVPPTNLVQQSRRGVHLVFKRDPAAAYIGNKQRIAGLHADVRGDHGIIMLAPSRVVNKIDKDENGVALERPYFRHFLDENGEPLRYKIVEGEWTKKCIDSLPIYNPEWFGLPREEQAPVAVAYVPREFTPEELTETVRGALRYIDAVPGAALNSGRHKAMFRVASKLVRDLGLPPEVAADVLDAYNAKLQPPYPRERLAGFVDQALKYGKSIHGTGNGAFIEK